MNVLSWNDVKLHGFDDNDERDPSPTLGRDRVGGHGNDSIRQRLTTIPARRSLQELQETQFSALPRNRINETKAVRYSLPPRTEVQPSTFGSGRSGSSYGRNEREVKLDGVSGVPYRHQETQHERKPALDLGRIRSDGYAIVDQPKHNVKADRHALQDLVSVPITATKRTQNRTLSEENELQARSVRLSLQKAADDPTTKVCPVLHKFTTVADLEGANFFEDPWHSKWL